MHKESAYLRHIRVPKVDDHDDSRAAQLVTPTNKTTQHELEDNTDLVPLCHTSCSNESSKTMTSPCFQCLCSPEEGRGG